jgi:hypothetical protein
MNNQQVIGPGKTVIVLLLMPFLYIAYEICPVLAAV